MNSSLLSKFVGYSSQSSKSCTISCTQGVYIDALEGLADILSPHQAEVEGMSGDGDYLCKEW